MKRNAVKAIELSALVTVAAATAGCMTLASRANEKLHQGRNYVSDKGRSLVHKQYSTNTFEDMVPGMDGSRDFFANYGAVNIDGVPYNIIDIRGKKVTIDGEAPEISSPIALVRSDTMEENVYGSLGEVILTGKDNSIIFPEAVDLKELLTGIKATRNTVRGRGTRMARSDVAIESWNLRIEGYENVVFGKNQSTGNIQMVTDTENYSIRHSLGDPNGGLVTFKNDPAAATDLTKSRIFIGNDNATIVLEDITVRDVVQAKRNPYHFTPVPFDDKPGTATNPGTSD